MAETGRLKLFWFSQTISAERGVQQCVEALAALNHRDIELHLLGYASGEVKKHLYETAAGVNLTFYHPVPPGNIISFASQFDVGLAMEDATPYNRDICLTNKIFTYIQAGLAVIASDTAAQSQLLKSVSADR